MQTYAESQAAKAALRAGRDAPVSQPMYIPPPPASNTGVIIAVVGGVAALGLVLVLMQKKK
jgi:hypothetical protein